MVGEFLGFFGLIGGEVVEFGTVGFEVVEFPRAGAALADEFEVADADGGVAFVFPEEGIARDGIVFESGDEAFAFHG